jgi:CheY-like chemotaxis protein
MRYALERHGFSVVAEVDSADEAFAAALFYVPQMCLMDSGLPGGAIAAADDIHSALSGTKIAMLSSTPYAGALYEAVRAGADGYLLRRTAPDRLAAALHAMLQGEAALPRALTGALLRELRNGASAPGRNGGSAPDGHRGSAPDRNGGSAAYRDGGSAPDRNGGSAAYRNGGSAPDRSGGSAPGGNGVSGRVMIQPRVRENGDTANSAILYVPRFVRHFRRRRRAGMPVADAWTSARTRMMEYR